MRKGREKVSVATRKTERKGREESNRSRSRGRSKTMVDDGRLPVIEGFL